MSDTYFLSEALRRRFQRNLQSARDGQRITAEEFDSLQHLADTGQAVVEPLQSCELYRLVLEDGAPESLSMVTTWVIERWNADVQVLYVDTLADGLLRFNGRQQLNAYVMAKFCVALDHRPAFELQRLEGPLFEQRMWQVIDHQARSLRWLAADLQGLPSLDKILDRVLASRFAGLWSGGELDLYAPQVQIVEQGDGSLPDQERVVRVQSIEQRVLDALTGKRLSAGQRCRVIGRRGQSLDFIDMSRFELNLADLKGEYEHVVDHYWHHPDEQGRTRRERFAQALADAFSHQVWSLQVSALSSISHLARITASPLHERSPVPVSRLSITLDGRGPYRLASLYLIHPQQGPCALYSPLKGIREFKDLQSLNDSFNGPDGRSELRDYLSPADQYAAATLASGTDLQVHHYPINQPLFYDCMDAIISLQANNLSAALKRHCPDTAGLRAMLDDALDVRALLDGQLPYIGCDGRWQHEPTRFVASWPSIPVAGVAPTPVPKPVSSPNVALALSWREQLNGIESTLRDISERHPSAEVFVRQALSSYLAVLGHPRPHEGQNIRLTWSEQGVCGGAERGPCEIPHAHGLTDLVLERISGAYRTPITSHDKVQLSVADSAAEVSGLLTVRLLEPVIGKVATVLQGTVTASFQAFYDQPLRTAKAQQQVSRTLCAARAQLLRLELAVARRQNVIAASRLELLQGVLDRPLSDMRRGSADVYRMTLTLSGRQFPLGLNIAWALQVPGQTRQGLLFWSPFTGLRAMGSGAELEAWLQQRLADPEWRSKWLAVFPDDERQWGDEVLAASARMTLSLGRVEGDFLQLMEHDSQQGQVREFATALSDARQQRLDAGTFKGSLSLADKSDWLLTWLDCLSIRVQSLLFSISMPDWVRQASLDDLECYLELAKRYFRTTDPADDFMVNVPTPQLFARPRLLEALQRDFPGQDLDPDNITVTVTVREPWSVMVGTGNLPQPFPASTQTHSQSLSGYAMNHFSQIHNGVNSISLNDGRPVPAGLDRFYMARLIHKLDIGLHYRTLLAERFVSGTPEYASRREHFMRQIPLLLLVAAIELKMQGVLSQTAFDYLENVLDMPDDVAREPLNGQHIVVRPLTLVPRQGMKGDTVEGFYLFGPKDPAQGPVILHVQLSEPFLLKEFRDHEHLLAELRAPGALQDLLLSRLEPQLRDRYGNDGLREAHLRFPAQGTQWIFDTTLDRPENVSLGTQVIEGNVLRHQFESVVNVMLGISRQQSVSSAEADWAEFVHLAGLLFDTAALFLPGKLGMLVALWQGEESLAHSLSEVVEQQWWGALSDFTLALATLVSTRHVDIQPMRMRLSARSSSLLWRKSASPAVLHQRLSQFEALDVDLSALRYDGLRNVYEDLATQRLYAIVEGKVYQVEHVDNVWRIKGRAGQGPELRLDAQQKWQLDLDPGLAGGLRSSSPLDRELDGVIDEFVSVRAVGMKNIRLYSREEARKITMARVQALGYLKNALFNLNAPIAKGLSMSVQRALGAFFGVEQVTPSMIDGVRQRFTELYAGLSQPSLAPLSSGRFILGRTKSGHESVSAFVVAGDPHKRIILNEDFFSPPGYSLKAVLPGNRAFNADDHYRASTLIHEMSHQACDAVDFAYLKAAAPPTEMIDASQPAWELYQRQLQVTRDRSLSHLTPKGRLFRIPDNSGLRDLRPKDGRLFNAMVRLTGKPTAKEARETFLSDPQVRSQVILGNADSITMLVNLLGRERFS